MESSYFLSPLNSTSQTYHTMPLHSDSVKSAIYANGIVTLGVANQKGRDNIYSFNATINRSHNLGSFQAFYGVDFIAGDYVIQKFSNTDITIPPTDNFFDAIGFNGGINLVVPFGKRGSEWRIIGVETSLQNEFGDYLKYRKAIADTTEGLDQTSNFTTTVGGYSEIIWKTKDNDQVGYKISCGTVVAPGNTYYGSASHNNPTYFLNTFHVTRKNVTAFGQIDIGTYTTSVQFGVNYRIGRNKKVR